eukprot:UN18630
MPVFSKNGGHFFLELVWTRELVRFESPMFRLHAVFCH